MAFAQEEKGFLRAPQEQEREEGMVLHSPTPIPMRKQGLRAGVTDGLKKHLGHQVKASVLVTGEGGVRRGTKKKLWRLTLFPILVVVKGMHILKHQTVHFKYVQFIVYTYNIPQQKCFKIKMHKN